MLLRLRKIERQPSSKEGKDGHPRLTNRERPGCRGCASLTVREMAVEIEEQREARLQRMSAMIDWLPNRERPGCSMIERD